MHNLQTVHKNSTGFYLYELPNIFLHSQHKTIYMILNYRI